MIISHRHRYIFIHCRKSAGSAVKVSLSRDLGPLDLQVGGWSDVINNGGKPNLRALACLGIPRQAWFYARSRLSGVPRTKSFNRMTKRVWRKRYRMGMFPGARKVRKAFPQAWEEYFKFCIVRNPWDRVVSDYFWRTKTKSDPPSFAEFVDAMVAGDTLDGTLRGNYSNWDMYTIDDAIAVDRVIFFENLEPELQAALDDAGIDWDGWLPRAKAGGKRPRDYRELYTEREVEQVRALCAREIEAFGYEF